MFFSPKLLTEKSKETVLFIRSLTFSIHKHKAIMKFYSLQPGLIFYINGVKPTKNVFIDWNGNTRKKRHASQKINLTPPPPPHPKKKEKQQKIQQECTWEYTSQVKL